MYAKDKEISQVEKANDSFINKLEHLIPNPRISYKYINGDGNTQKLHKPNYLFLMSYYEEHIDTELFLKQYKNIIDKYDELSKKFYYNFDALSERIVPVEMMRKYNIKEKYLYGQIKKEIKRDLSMFGYNDIEITDILVQYLYGIKESGFKSIFWICYGEYALNNLKKHFEDKTKTIQCVECGEWFNVLKSDKRTCRCNKCNNERKREQARIRAIRFRERHSNAI